MSIVEVKVPDIGDFKEVEVIELMVKPGDTIKVDQSLITVESDKASMEIPSSHAGVGQGTQDQGRRQESKEGSLLLILEVSRSRRRSCSSCRHLPPLPRRQRLQQRLPQQLHQHRPPRQNL